ncbi:MAG: hypothetical protein AB7O65_13755, partial [Candidatus Korobacteraceae bacterium]
MAMRTLALLCGMLVLPSTFVRSQGAAEPAPREAGRLPVRKVVLYKNGVGYFEHLGRVRDSQELAIDFTTAQLNDVLKSLTVMDLGGGRVTGVRYDSLAPVSIRMRGLRLPLPEHATRNDVLMALRGARVEYRSAAATITGRVLSVEQRTISDRNGESREITELSLVADGGRIHTVELGAGSSVRVLESDSSADLSRYLDLANSSRSRDLRRMVVATAGTGEREVFVSYISEVPVWKSTYRIVLRPNDKPLLQGWAIVDNTVGEDWTNAQLSLVAGAPQSFVQDISQPYYTRRPSVPLPASALLTPQTHEGTMENQMQFMVDVGGGGGVAAGSMSPSVNAARDQVRSERARELAAKAAAPPPPPVPQSVEVQADAQELGDQFSYELQQRITIAKDQSALVPILQEPIEAEKITLWNPSSKRPLRALWIRNTSALTLDSGSFNVVEAGAFAGEGVLDTIKPTERRFLSYAADAGVRVDAQRNSPPGLVSRVRVFRGVMSLTRERHESNTYVVHNADTSARQVIVEHPARDGWKLAESLKPAETTASYYRFRVPVEPGKTEKLVVSEYRPEVSSYTLSNLTSDQITIWTSERALNPALEKQFREII